MLGLLALNESTNGGDNMAADEFDIDTTVSDEHK
jgi:hypothetical protein